MAIAERILKEHFYCDVKKTESLRAGLKLLNKTQQFPMRYWINYYSGSDDQLTLEYVIVLFAKDGLCYSADYRNYQYPDEVLLTMDGIYWSEYYDMVRMEDGSFQRVKR